MLIAMVVVPPAVDGTVPSVVNAAKASMVSVRRKESLSNPGMSGLGMSHALRIFSAIPIDGTYMST